jgi:hypothetical protein
MTRYIPNYIVDASFTSLVFKNGRTIFEKIAQYIKHPWKCSTYLDKLEYVHRGKMHSIYADRICFVCNKKENRLLVYQEVKNDGSN